MGQNVKTRKQKYILTTEIYQIDKKTKKREGKYFEIWNSSNDTLIKGQYRNDAKNGLWTFFDKGKSPFLVFNFDKDSCCWVDPNICRRDSFPVREGQGLRFAVLDRPPLFLGYRHEFENYLRDGLKLPVYIMQNGQRINITVSFVVGKSGEVKDLEIIGELKKEVTNLILGTDHKWLTGTLNGVPVETQLYAIFTIAPATEVQKLPATSYLTRVYYPYFGVTTTRRVQVGQIISTSGKVFPESYSSRPAFY
jgi:hypothetical protein